MSSRIPRIFAVVSNKGGVGKTTTCMNLGTLWAAQGRRVLMMDLDPAVTLTRVLTESAESENRERSVCALFQPKKPGSVIELARKTPFGVDLIPGYAELADLLVSMKRNPFWGNTLAKPLQQDLPYDAVLIDSAPGYQDLRTVALCASTDAIVVMQVEGAAVWQSGEVLSEIDSLREGGTRLRRRWIVINLKKVRRGQHRAIEASLRQSSAVGRDVCATVIPDKASISDGMTLRQPITKIDPKGAGALYRDLATEIWGELTDG